MSSPNENQALLQQLDIQQVMQMMDLVPDILFWVKDNQGYFVHGNLAFLEHQGVNKLEQLKGKNDFDFAPDYLAKQYVRDDQRILKGHEVTNRLEMNTTETGEIAWFSTSKRPIHDVQGKIIGSYGITRHFQKRFKALSHIDAIQLPVEFIRNNFHRAISVEDIADVAHLSVSALERRFRKHLSKTPKQFLNEIRLENARKMLVESEHSIAQIAFETGFSDHSYFSRQFRLFFGELPSDIRKSYTK